MENKKEVNHKKEKKLGELLNSKNWSLNRTIKLYLNFRYVFILLKCAFCYLKKKIYSFLEPNLITAL